MASNNQGSTRNIGDGQGTGGQRRWATVLLAAALVLPVPGALAARNAEDRPSAGRMMADAVVARPVGALMTVVGATAFVVTLPLSLLGGNTGEAGRALVVEPARETFLRCLGCTRVGEQRTTGD